MLKIHITGQRGGIGSFLSEALEIAGHEIVPAADPKLRIEDPAYFDQFENPEKIDILYHLAAASFVPKSWEVPAEFIKVNVLGTTHVLEFCRTNKIKLIYVSSYAYGIPQYLPIDEKHPVAAANPYGLSKIMAEEICQFYGQNYDLSYIIVRPFNVYGTLKNKALLIPEIIEQIEKGNAINVKDLEPKRDYVFIDDLIDFLVVSKENINNEIYNVGSGKSLSVQEIIDTCQKVWNSDLPVYSADSVRKNEIPETRSNIDKAAKNFSWTPQFSFERGIAEIKKRLAR